MWKAMNPETKYPIPNSNTLKPWNWRDRKPRRFEQQSSRKIEILENRNNGTPVNAQELKSTAIRKTRRSSSVNETLSAVELLAR